jgi:glycosyltransferase involved in cell wall biosynthesis
MRALKILVFAAYYHPFKGGYIESIHRWAKRLTALGHTVTVVTCKVTDSAEEERIEGVRVLRLPAWHLLKGTYPVLKPRKKTRAILNALKKEGYDIVSTQTRFFTTSFWGTHFARRNKIPHIHTERGATHSIVEKKWVEWASKIVDHTLGRYVVRNAQRNVGVSEAACAFLKHLGARHTVCIHNGVDLIEKLSLEQKEEWRTKHALSPTDTVLLFVGRLIYAKGVQDVLSILPALIPLKPHLKCVIIGEGPYRKTLEEIVQKRGLNNAVHFVGEQPFSKVKEWLQVADYMVNPSHSEGLPRSVLEGGAAGLPIVATDTGGTKEIIEERISGRLVPPQDPQALQQALSELLSEPGQAKKQGDALRTHIEKKFIWEAVVQAYVDLAHPLL